MSRFARDLNSEERLFELALAFETREEQVDFLTAQCGAIAEPESRELFDSVLQLLNAHHRSPGLLDSNAKQFLSEGNEELEPLTGTCIGNYQVQEEIGRGGMGVVYRAEQVHPLRRRVALKVIKLGMDTKKVIGRFEGERQALAILDHPSITRVLDAGSTQLGRPYFVMELVDGTSITEYCRSHRLKLRDRLKLFARVCDGVQHAHQKGIIHRDIKPSNVMVTLVSGEANPKIIDFGVAKAMTHSLSEHTVHTSATDLIGTPQYMSPEQASRNGAVAIDTRSDVYGLGVLLYELLTSTTPFPGIHSKPVDVIRDIIAKHDPDRPSLRTQGQGATFCVQPDDVKGDLDWITLKCLAKNPDDRYQSAADLKRDIQRHLKGKPVEAAAPTLRYRVSKFTKQNRSALSVAAVITLLLVCGVVVSTTLAIQATRMARLADANAHQAKAHLQNAKNANSQLVNQAKTLREERDRAMAMERELAALNETQLQRTAIFKAIARYNESIANDQREFLSRIESKASPSNLSGDAPTAFTEYFIQAHPGETSEEAITLGASLVNIRPVSLTLIDSTRDDFGLLRGFGLDSFLGQASVDERLLEYLIEEQRKMFGGGHNVHVAGTLRHLGGFLHLRERNFEATQALIESRDILETINLKEALWTEVTLLLALTLEATGNRFEAEQHFDLAYEVYERMALPSNELAWLVQQTECQLTKTLLSDGTTALAVSRQEVHPELVSAIRPDRAWDQKILRMDAAALYRAYERFRLDVARQQMLATLIENTEDVSVTRDEAREGLFHYVLMERRRMHGSLSPIVATTLRDFGEWQLDRGRLDLALGQFFESAQVLGKHSSHRVELAEVYLFIATIFFKQGRDSIGKSWLNKAVAILDDQQTLPQGVRLRLQRTLDLSA